MVHHFSTHNLLLRYWLAAAGADPERDVEIVVVPPQQVVETLAEGRIAGFCAGAPWGDAAQHAGAGRILLGSSAIWPCHPEKCLVLAETWADANVQAAQCLLRAVLRARKLCDMPAEAPAIAALLSHPDGLALPARPTRAALPGGEGIEQVRFHASAAAFPSPAHAAWFLGQMRHWGWIGPDTDLDAVARRVYRPDVLSPAAEAEGMPARMMGEARVRLPATFPREDAPRIRETSA